MGGAKQNKITEYLLKEFNLSIQSGRDFLSVRPVDLETELFKTALQPYHVDGDVSKISFLSFFLL